MRQLARWGLQLTLVLGLPAMANSLATARAQAKALQYPQAAKTLNQVESERGLTHDEVLEYYEQVAIVSATLGEADRARAAFAKLLALSPEYALKGRFAPRVTTPYHEGKALSREQGGPTATFGPANATTAGVVALTLTCANLASWRATELEVHLTMGAESTTLSIPAAATVPIPVKGSSVVASAILRDSRGWALLEVPQQRFEALTPPSAPMAAVLSPPPFPTTQPALSASKPGPAVAAASPRYRGVALGLGVAGGLALLVGAGAGYITSDLTRQFDTAPVDGRGVVTDLTRTRALQLQEQTREAALAANVGFAASGVLLAAAAGAFFLGAPVQPSVALLPGEGAALAMSGQF